MNIRIKVLLPIAIAIPIFIVSGLFFWKPLLVKQEIEQLLSHEKELLQNIQPILERDLLIGDLSSIYVTLDRIREIKDNKNYHIELYNSSGRRLYPLKDYPSFSSEKIFDFKQTLQTKNHLLGEIHLKMDWQHEYADIEASLLAIEIIGVIIFIVVLLVIYLLLEWIVNKPLSKLKNVAIKIADGDFNCTVPQEGNDEISQLSQTLCYMQQNILAMHSNLEQKAFEAKKANTAKSEFLSSMSHEFRTPLNAILGLAQLFEQDNTLTERQRSNAKEILHSGSHLLSLINEILDLSRIESGYTELSLENVQLANIMDECLAVIEPMAEASGIVIGLESSYCRRLSVVADHTRLKQVLLNLLSNSIKYNHKNGFVGIGCSVTQEGKVRLSIRDTGKGIPKNLQDKLFQPFSRLDKEFSDTEGTGIGLVIVKQLMDLMGGQVGVESKWGEGTTFWVELELSELQEFEPDSQSTEEDNERKTEILLNGRILVAEENKANQVVLKQQLELFQLQVDFVDNGVAALKLWRQGKYDLILTDVHMPIMDGYKLVKNIRLEEQRTGKHIPVIAITANAMKNDQARCLESGMDAFIAKPVLLEQLRSLLIKMLPPQNLESNSVSDERQEEKNQGLQSQISTCPVDTSIISAQVGNDLKKHCRLLQVFVELTPEVIRSIETSFAEKDEEGVYQESHKLKSSARVIGAIELTDVCQALEIDSRERQWDAIARNLPRLNVLYDEIKRFVEETCITQSNNQPLAIVNKRDFKVLLIDDDQVVLDVEEMMLQEMGIEDVATELSGNNALKCIAEAGFSFDIILCDLNMPEMDGIEFLRHLAKTSFDGFIVLVSGEGERILKSAEKLAAEHQLNILGVVSKPITPRAIQNVFEKLDNKSVTVQYDPDQNQEFISPSELKNAIENDELVVFYQPKVNVDKHKSISMEALVRWQHPVWGMISPVQFIKLAEDCGLINSLTRNVLYQAVNQIAKFATNNIDVQIAINLSVNTLYDLEFPDFAMKVVKEAGLKPSSITFEITETRLMDNLASALEVLTRLSIKKFILSIDDFGTGYSSMEQLQRAAFSELKIDRSFVSGASNDSSSMAILESSVQLAKKMNLKIVAEGVETQEDMELMESLGCDEVQGYFIARPMPDDEVEAWVRQWYQL